MNRLWIDVVVAARSLLQHTKRTLLLGGAIAAVTALLVLLVGLSTGIRETMLRSATTLMTGHVNVGGFYKVTAGQSAPVVTDYPKVLAAVEKALPGQIDYSVERGRGWAKLISDTGSQQVGVGGIEIAKEGGFKKVLQIEQGKIDDLAQPNTILIFEEQAKKLEVKVGDALTLSAPTSRGVNNTIDVRVVAIAKSVGLLSSFNTYVPAETLRKLYDLRDDATGVIYIYLHDVNQAGAAASTLRLALAKDGFRMMDPNPAPFFKKFDSVNREDWTGQKLDVTTWDDEISFLNWTLTALNFLSVLLIGILLVIVVIGIMNTMWIAIRERTREIGTLRAIGMQRRRVLFMFLVESLLLGVMSTAAGALLGNGVALLLNHLDIGIPTAVRFFLMSDHLNLSMHLGAALGAIVGISVVTMIAAFYPALRAARLKPVTAMYHIG